jgi:hypothetical protein
MVHLRLAVVVPALPDLAEAVVLLDITHLHMAQLEGAVLVYWGKAHLAHHLVPDMEEVVVQVAQLEQTVNPSVQQVLLERFMAVPMAAAVVVRALVMVAVWEV